MKPYGYTELSKDLLKLRAVYNEKASVEFIGTSVKGRALPLIKIGGGKRKILAVGAVHGREFISSAFLMRSVFELVKSGAELFEKSLYVVPVLNPDGVEIALKQQATYKNNANDVNLNANFPFCFECVPESRQGGECAASEPETKALIGLCEEANFAAAISLHARGNCIFWRDFGNGRVEGDAELAQAFAQNCGFELVAPTENVEDYSGGFENWFRFRFGKPALCIELVKDEDIGFADMCLNFDEAVIWSKTGRLLRTFLELS